MTGGNGRPPVDSSSSDPEQTEERPSPRRRRGAKKRVVKDAATSTDEGSLPTDSSFSLSSSGHDSETDVSGAPVVAAAPKSPSPPPTTEVPLYWKPMDGQDRVPRSDLKDVFDYNHRRPQLAPPGSGRREALLNVRLVKVDTHEPSPKPRGVESMDLHSLVDLHKQLEKERKEMPGELVVPGKVSSIAVAMLIDSGASVSIISTGLWEVLHREEPGWTLLSTDCCIRTVSGERATVRGRTVLEVELGGHFYVHQFIVLDVAEDMILGLDFIQKFKVDCNWKKGVLCLQGDEVQACRRYSLGDGRVRRLLLSVKTVLPALSQIVVDTQVQGRAPGDLPDWGMVSPAQKPTEVHGVVPGKALVDPRCSEIPVPVMNPGTIDVVLPKYTLIGFLIPVQQIETPLTETSQTAGESDDRTGSARGRRDGRQSEGQTGNPTGADSADRFGDRSGSALGRRNGRQSEDQTGGPTGADSADRTGQPNIVRTDAFEVLVSEHSASGANLAPSVGEPVRCVAPECREEDEFRAWQEEKRQRELALAPDTNVPRTLVESPRLPPEAEQKLSDRFYQKRWTDYSDTESAPSQTGTDEQTGRRPSGRDTYTGREPVAPITGSDPQSLVPPHLKKLYERSLDCIQEEERPALVSFLREYEDVFARDANDLGRSSAVQHRIDTGDAMPIKQPPRRVPLHKKMVVQEEVEKMLNRGVIEPSDGPWASPIVLVTKKDGSTRFCVDFRRLNEATKKDAYPLPRIEDNLDTLQGAKYYSTLDLISGFWQVEMAPEDRDKTAFTVGGGGLYRFLTMPFGLCNAPATFQRLMERVLRGLQWEVAVLYIDDIIVFADTVESHLQRLGAVLDRLRQAGLKLKPEKCELLRERVAFLGHIVSAKGVEVDRAKIIKIQTWPVPRNLTELRSFIGLCAYYRRFVPNFSAVCKPLFVLTQKEQPYFWGGPQHHAMETMKKLLTSAPILGYPRNEGRYILDCDASNIGLGAVLSQEQDGQEKVIAYASKTLNKPERNYCVTRRELLAIITFTKQFHHYLYGARFLVRTDHAALYWLLRKKDPEGQMARWITFLQAYDLEIQHRPGVRHGNADALSRCMEGCRDLDTLQLPCYETSTLDEIKERAMETLRRVQTRSQAKRQPVEVRPGSDSQTEVKEVDNGTSTVGRPKAAARSHQSAAETAQSNPVVQTSRGEISSPTSRDAATGPRLDRTARPTDGRDSPIVGNSRGETSVPVSRDAATGPRPDQPAHQSDDRDSPTVGKQSASPTETASDTGHMPPSRPPVDVAEAERQEQFFREQLPETWSDEAMAFLQDRDADLAKVKAWFREDLRPDWDTVAKEGIVVKTWWGR